MSNRAGTFHGADLLTPNVSSVHTRVSQLRRHEGSVPTSRTFKPTSENVPPQTSASLAASSAPTRDKEQRDAAISGPQGPTAAASPRTGLSALHVLHATARAGPDDDDDDGPASVACLFTGSPSADASANLPGVNIHNVT